MSYHFLLVSDLWAVQRCLLRGLRAEPSPAQRGQWTLYRGLHRSHLIVQVMWSSKEKRKTLEDAGYGRCQSYHFTAVVIASDREETKWERESG